MKCSKVLFAVVSVFFAAFPSSSIQTLNAREADIAPPTFAAAQTAKQQCMNTCRARYRDCLSLIANSILRVSWHSPRIVPATPVMLVQLVDRLGQDFRRN